MNRNTSNSSHSKANSKLQLPGTLTISSYQYTTPNPDSPNGSSHISISESKISNYSMVMCDSITIPNMNQSNASVVSYSDSDSERFLSREEPTRGRKLSSFAKKSGSKNISMEISILDEENDIVKKFQEKSKKNKKRHSEIIPNRTPTPNFKCDFVPREPQSSRLPPLENINFKKEEITPKTNASNESRNSGKTVISEDSPAYQILKGNKCKNIRKYRFKISDKVSYFLC